MQCEHQFIYSTPMCLFDSHSVLCLVRCRCDPEIADPVVLADYVIVLLKNDERSTDALKEHCRAKLSDFLDNETDGFIAELFGYLDSKILFVT